MMPFPAVLPTGGLLPESVLNSHPFKILATFVAINTLMYATLALVKILPKGYSLFGFNGRNRRITNRSIYPESATPELLNHRDHLSRLDDDLPDDDMEVPFH